MKQRGTAVGEDTQSDEVMRQGKRVDNRCYRRLAGGRDLGSPPTPVLAASAMVSASCIVYPQVMYFMHFVDFLRHPIGALLS